jgi:SnoaL-like domain
MDIAEKLLAIEEIKQLKSRYFRLMDTKDWNALAGVFCADATFDARAALSVDGRGEGGRAAESNDWIYRGVTVHHGHCHEIDILTADDASGVIAMEDQIWEPLSQKLTLHGAGHYHETYRRVDGRWRIHTSRITRLYVALA